jgi:indole-3-glycerol phosphate synthase
MAQVLDSILAYKRKEVEVAKASADSRTLRARAEAQPAVRPFAEALRSRIAKGHFALIAEIKKASPSGSDPRRSIARRCAWLHETAAPPAWS